MTVSTPPKRRRSDGERSRQSILLAATRLATVEGLEGLSIARLADASGISVVLDARVVEKAGKTPVTATLNNIPLDTAVRLLADMADLKAVAIDNVLYVTAKANAEALQAEQDKRKALAREQAKNEKAAPVESAPKKAGEPVKK